MLTKFKKLKNNEDFVKYLKNTSWMFFEYVMRLISSIFVTIYIARFLGPEQFGILSYALAIITLFLVISRFGMDSILVRDLAKNPDESKKYIGTAFILMFLASIVSILCLNILIYLFESSYEIKIYILILSVSILFQTLLVFDYAFQAEVKAKYSSISKSLALVVASSIKIYLVWIKAELLYFVIIYSSESIFIGLFLLIAYYKKNKVLLLPIYDSKLAKEMVQSSWPMVLAAISSILYMRIDQIMIKNMLDTNQLGIYSSAVKIYEGWIMIPYIISISLLPAIIKLKASYPERYIIGFTKLFSSLFWVSILVALIVSFFGEYIIIYTFGSAYIDANKVLMIVMWTGAFVALGSVSARYLTIEGMEKKIAFRTFLALIINIIANIVLIPIYGIEGAAIATLISIIFTNYVLNYIDKDLKELWYIQNSAIFFLNIKNGDKK